MPSLKDVRILEFANLRDDRGSIVPVTGGTDIPFAISRVFTVHPAQDGQQRGGHAHRRCKQVLSCLAGACKVVCRDGSDSREFLLDRPDQGLYVPETIWAEQSFLSRDTVLMVLSDRPYEEDDYIRDGDEYATFRGNMN